MHNYLQAFHIYCKIMKSTILVAFLFLSLKAIAQKDNPKYEKGLADSLGGDEYGMKPYVLVILKTGTNKIDKKETVDSLFK